MSTDIQNEILGQMALSVLREIVKEIKGNQWFTIMEDEVNDCSNKEQLIICLRYVSESLEPMEKFIGLYQVDNIKSETLVNAIKDALTRVILRIEDCRGQCYDGASNMAGSRSGVSTAILKEVSKAVFTHCYGHSLQLAVCDTIKNIPNFNDALATVFEISKLIKFSAKRGNIFEKLKEELAPGTPGLRVLCPTRWTVRGASLQSIIDNWNVLHEVWKASLEESLDTEVRASICGVLYQMSKFEFYFCGSSWCSCSQCYR